MPLLCLNDSQDHEELTKECHSCAPEYLQRPSKTPMPEPPGLTSHVNNTCAQLHINGLQLSRKLCVRAHGGCVERCHKTSWAYNLKQPLLLQPASIHESSVRARACWEGGVGEVLVLKVGCHLRARVPGTGIRP